MTNPKRQVEIFSAGCSVCEDTVRLVNEIACDSCDVTVLDMHDPEGAARARQLDVRSVPAVAVDGKLAGCCENRGPDKDTLRAAGIGQG